MHDRPHRHHPPPASHFSFPSSSSESSSRSSSPIDAEWTSGRKPGEDVYETTLRPRWRGVVRKKLVEWVRTESEVIARIQHKIRTPWLDAYFVYTSSLGTHTFFMILLPAFFFFGYGELGRGLLTVLAVGIYLSSFIKDLFCSPRPFAPPVTRLTIGTHHLEYGFPSTHSTNSVSIALFFFTIFQQLQESTTSSVLSSPALYISLYTLLIIYTVSIVFGRLYTAMHSFTDCLMGIILGTGVWWVHTDWPGVPVTVRPWIPGLASPSFLPLSVHLHLGRGLDAGRSLERWVASSGWQVPLTLIPLCLLAVHKHPQPVDDCPCFEDAIAILSVVMGAFLSRWGVCFLFSASPSSSSSSSWYMKEVVMPGSGWVRSSGDGGGWISVERGWNELLVWWSIAVFKMTIGILTIFIWRIIAKSTLHLILPPIFRLLSRFFRLPKRRFYTPATEYTSLPSEFEFQAEEDRRDGTTTFLVHRPIPSVIDLPGSIGQEVVGGIGSGVESVERVSSGLKMRNGIGEKRRTRRDLEDKERRGGKDKLVKHYDADVLTKVIVYAGIAVLATEVLPFVFNILGLGVKSWPVDV